MNRNVSIGVVPSLEDVSVALGDTQYDGTYIYDKGVVCVTWNNSNDFKRHQLGAVTSEPANTAKELLRAIVMGAKARGEVPST